MDHPSRIVLVSDSHAHLRPLRKLLQALDVVDEHDRWIGGSHTQLWHLGDMLHRGPDDTQVLDYLLELPAELVRLHVGNHEGQYLGAPRCSSTWHRGMDDRLMQLIETGRLHFASAFTDDDRREWLCVHGGLDARWKDLQRIGAQRAAQRLNELALDVVHDRTYWVEIVGSGTFRGGDNLVSGILWADVESDLKPREKQLKISQVVGHHEHDQVCLSPLGKLWSLNVPLGHAQALVHTQGEGFAISERFA